MLENVQIQQPLDSISKEGWQSPQSMSSVIANSLGYAAFIDLPTDAFMNAGF